MITAAITTTTIQSVLATTIMASTEFRFKQFTIRHDKCAMKVGTDGVILGAWCPISNFQFQISNTPFSVLDVGTGSGLIARMLMQRCPEAQIDAIDIDPNAVEQARENGVNAYLSRLQDWPDHQSAITDHQYDLIVSNPPYFQNSLKNPDKGRELARHTDSLSYEELVKHSARLMKAGGRLALILPADAEQEVHQLAAAENLFLTRVTHVYSKETKPARRVLLCFAKIHISNFKFQIVEDSLILEDEKGGRSAAYSELCSEFYL